MTRKIIRNLILGCLIFLLLFFSLGKLFNPKWNYYGNQAQTRVQSFYQQPKDSIDVLYTGASFAYCGISPLSIYEKYGITGYVFANPSQKSYMSYYYLQEALKTQSPSVVVYEVGTAADDSFATEGYHRKNLDYTKWSREKWDTIQLILKNCADESIKDYLFPLLRYHSRWEDLSSADFNISTDKDYYLMGTALKLTRSAASKKAINKYHDWSSDKEASVAEMNQEYILKMKELCEKNGSSFLLLKVPSLDWSPAISDAVSKFAEENQIPFLDLNLHQEELAIDWTTDSHDAGSHVNLLGAKKVSDYLGAYLSENYSFSNTLSNEDADHWKTSAEKFQQLLDSFSLNVSQELSEYLSIASDENYTVMFSLSGQADQVLSEEQRQALLSCGLTLPEAGSSDHYYAVLDGGKLIAEESGKGKLRCDLEVDPLKVRVVSGKNSVIKVNDGEYARNTAGLNIVVYDKALQKIADSAVFTVKEDGSEHAEHTTIVLVSDDGGE
ncbi:MAG: hypothetical protein Q4B01_07040 [Eubacteriales bacterium]|nr:hypothetical protein [Eubacteriales bacterium]